MLPVCQEHIQTLQAMSIVTFVLSDLTKMHPQKPSAKHALSDMCHPMNTGLVLRAAPDPFSALTSNVMFAHRINSLVQLPQCVHRVHPIRQQARLCLICKESYVSAILVTSRVLDSTHPKHRGRTLVGITMTPLALATPGQC